MLFQPDKFESQPPVVHVTNSKNGMPSNINLEIKTEKSFILKELFFTKFLFQVIFSSRAHVKRTGVK